MTLEQLRVFIAVAEREHLTQASAALGRTQSAVSAALAALERQHDLKLFDRIGRRILLTAAGKAFLPIAKALLAQALAAEHALVDLAGSKRGMLHIGASQTIGNYWLPPLLMRMTTLYPDLSISLTIGNTEQIAAQTLNGDVDLAFVEGVVEGDQLSSVVIGGDALVFAASPSLSATKDVAEVFSSARWIVREKGSGTRAAWEAEMNKRGLTVASLRKIELPSNEAIRSAVENGSGVALISRLVVDSGVKAGTLRLLAIPPASRPFFLLRHSERYLSRAALSLIELAGSAHAPVQPHSHGAKN